VLGALAEGIPAAAHAGAVEAGGTTITVMPGGAERADPASKRALYEAILGCGCALSELPVGASTRRWSYAARGRIVAGLACIVVVVEAEDRASDLTLPRFAQSLGRVVTAVPGRVTSPASRGTHALISSGAPLVRDAQDALDLLYGAGHRSVPEPPGARGAAKAGDMGRTLGRVLELVEAGADTADRLVAKGVGVSTALAALTELELAGQVERGHGGRYLPCARLAARGPARL
jgi:DNA processing protein